VDWGPQLETRFEEQEEAMVGPEGLLLDSGAMDSAHRIVVTFHSSKEHDLPEPAFGLSLLGNASSMTTEKRLYGQG